MPTCVFVCVVIVLAIWQYMYDVRRRALELRMENTPFHSDDDGRKRKLHAKRI